MKSIDAICQILEGRKCTVDIACEPQPVLEGFVSFHQTGKPSKKTIIKVRERLIGYKDAVKAVDSALVELLAEERRCQSKKSGSD